MKQVEEKKFHPDLTELFSFFKFRLNNDFGEIFLSKLLSKLK